jgi:ATP-dependent DNA helicase MPH1
VRGDQLELYGDVERLIPDHVKPECLEKKMDIEEYIREEKGKGKKAAAAESSTGATAAAKKRKRDADDMGRNIPAGAAAGFVKASELKKRKKRKVKEFDPLAGEDDDTDREIEAGIDGPRRTLSASAAPSGSPKIKKKALRKAATMDVGGKKTTKEKKKKKKKTAKIRQVELPTGSQISHLGVDDSDDMEIEKGIDLALRDSSSPDPLSPPPLRKRHKSPVRLSSSPDPLTMDQDVEFESTKASVATASSLGLPRSSSSRGHPKSQNYWTPSPDIPIADDVIDISSSPPPSPSGSSALQSKPSSTIHRSGGSSKSAKFATSPPVIELDEDKSMAWLLEGDDDPEIEIYDSSPGFNRKRPSSTRPTSNHDDTIEIVDSSIPSSPADRGSRQPQFQRNDSVEIVENNSVEVLSSKPLTATPLIPLHFTGASPRRRKPIRNVEMLPPDLPVRLAIPSPVSVSDPEYPDPSFAVRPAGRRLKKRVVMPSDSESPLLDMSQRRLHHGRSESSPTPALGSRPRPQKRPDPNALRKLNPWIDMEAAHSGDEVSEGSSQVDEVETESDQQFLQGYPETQVSPSYDQTLAYRQSLFTQAPARGKAPVFENRPAVRGALYAAGSAIRRRPLVSSSPPINGDEPNEYLMGSFVVDDDAEITYASSDI